MSRTTLVVFVMQIVHDDTVDTVRADESGIVRSSRPRMAKCRPEQREIVDMPQRAAAGE